MMVLKKSTKRYQQANESYCERARSASSRAHIGLQLAEQQSGQLLLVSHRLTLGALFCFQFLQTLHLASSATIITPHRQHLIIQLKGSIE